MKQNSVNASSVNSLTDAELIKRYELLGNNRQCYGASVKGRKLVQKRLRALGVKYYVAIFEATEECGAYATTGRLLPGETPPSDASILEVGVSMQHAIHKLGKGDAKLGWDLYFSV